MKVLITGGAGFIGSHIVDLLIEHGHEVIVIDNLTTGKLNNVHPQAIFHQFDITDTRLDEILKDHIPDIIIHQAAQAYVQKSMEDPLFDSKVNISGTLNLLQFAKRHQIRKFIYASSGSVYGEPPISKLKESHPASPVSFYALSKYMGEMYTRFFHEQYLLDYTILRYANVYGPRQKLTGEGRVIPFFIENMKKGIPPVIYGDGEQTRDFIYVKDVAEVTVLAMNKGSQQTFNIGTGSGTSINHLFMQLAQILKYTLPAKYQSERAGDVKHSSLDVSKAQIELGWHPTYALKQGLYETVKHYESD